MSDMNNRITLLSFTRRGIRQGITPLLAVAVCLSVAMLTAAEKKKAEWDASKLPPVASKTGLTFDKDIRPILEKSCVKCHSGEKPKSKYRMDTLQNVIKGGESGDPAIVPSNSAKSPMIAYVSDLVEDMEMPPTEKREKYPQLTKEQIGLIRAWIDQGAK
jgi:hypothetical protein